MSSKSKLKSKSSSNLPRYQKAQIDFDNEEERRNNQKIKKYKENIHEVFKEY